MHVLWWGINVHGYGSGVILISPTRAHYLVAMKLRFSYTNNMAEYETCIAGLKAALDMNLRYLRVYGDSIMTISQSTEEWGVKSPELTKYKRYLTKTPSAFSLVLITCRASKINLQML